jgi:hypothetical protein
VNDSFSAGAALWLKVEIGQIFYPMKTKLTENMEGILMII